MNTGMVTIVITVITVIISMVAFNNPRVIDRLILWPPAIARQREYERLVTHGFIHADGMHLAFNMITLFSFGSVVEGFFIQYIGWAGYALFYLSAIVVAILPTYLRHREDASYRSLGASGAVSAILFGHILLHPSTQVLLFFAIPVNAVVFAVIYIAYSIYMDRRGGDNVNHSAHLWGAGYGVLVMLLMEPRLMGHFLRQIGMG
jgi:membrane associated rhomboid family serine protease